MKISKLLALLALFILLVSTFTIVYRPYVAAQEFGTATLTGNVLDRGVDTNGNGLYNYLEIDVEINVTVAGNFQVSITGLFDNYNYISDYNSSEGVLDTGIQYLNVSLSSAPIFGSGLNPQEISSIDLQTETESSSMHLDSVYNVALSRVYNYSEFDPHAYLTGHISDHGVDTDGDGLFNYLEVGIEFNVTQPGQYDIIVDGLMEKTGNTTEYLSDSHYEQGYFAVGVNTYYMNFSGPEIASNNFNPTNVSNVHLYDATDGVQTSQLKGLPLSMAYDHTLFNAPSKDIQVNLKVYPDATVGVGGSLNFTHMYPDNAGGPQINATVDFSTSGNLTTETSNGTVFFPENMMNNNTVETHLRSTYLNGLENATLNASMVLTPEEAGVYPYNTTDINLNAAYSGGLFDASLTGQTVMPTPANDVLPFNMSDATLLADFDGTKLTGNITFHSIAGFPLADVTVNFSGNRTNLSFAGNFNVTYVSYDGLEINQTTLDQEIANLTTTFTGQGEGSLYNESSGNLECTNINLTKIPWSDPSLGADVIYNATVIGNFTGALAAAMFPSDSQNGDAQQFAYACFESLSSSVRNASLIINYYHGSQTATFDLHLTCDGQTLWNSLLALAPPATPPSWSLQQTQMQAWLQLANSTMYATTDAVVNASYSSADREMVLNAWLLANASQLKNNLVSILPNLARSDMHDLIESYLNTTHTTLDSSTTTFDMVNETATFSSQAILQGDFESQLNLAKRVLIQVLYPPPPANPSAPWDIQMLNDTEINIDNFQAKFELGTDWMYANFSGLILKPQQDNVDAITFKLKTWLNEANDPNAPPQEFEKLSVTITGGSSANQTVLLSTPSDVPSPDYSSTDGRTMSWNNASLNSLKDLAFLTAFQSNITYEGTQYNINTLTNSTVKNLVFDPDARKITFNVTGPAGTEGFCNVTIPKNLFQSSSLNDWAVTFDGKLLSQGNYTITQNAEYVFLYLNYTHSEHVIVINVPPVISEYRPNFLPLALTIALILAAIAAFGQRRKFRPMKNKCHQKLANEISMLRKG